MMPASPNNQRPDTRLFCWLTAGSMQARVGPLNSQPLASAILSATAQFDLSSHPAHQCSMARKSWQPPRSKYPRPHAVAKDAMRRTKAALVFLRSPSSYQQRKETFTWIMQSPIRQPRLSSAVHWS